MGNAGNGVELVTRLCKREKARLSLGMPINGGGQAGAAKRSTRRHRFRGRKRIRREWPVGQRIKELDQQLHTLQQLVRTGTKN